MEIRTHLAGGKFRSSQSQSITIGLEPEDLLDLEREPDNMYDANAIKILRDGAHLGYVPAKEAVHIAPYMDSGEEFECHCVGHLAPLMPYLRIRSLGDIELQAAEPLDDEIPF